MPLIYYPRDSTTPNPDAVADPDGVLQPFRGGRHSWQPWRPAPSPLEARRIPITVRQLSTWMPAATINLHVAPKRTTIHREFYFRYKAGTLALQRIKVPSYLGSSLKVEAEFGSGAAALLEGPTLRLQYGVEGAGSRESFLVYFYSEEEGGFHPVETWQVLTESFETGEAKASLGETRSTPIPPK